jgi:hypothetical protein
MNLQIVGEKFILGQEIVRGSFGRIHEGFDVQTDAEVAIKLESVTAKHPQLLHEIEVYRLLQGKGEVFYPCLIHHNATTVN